MAVTPTSTVEKPKYRIVRITDSWLPDISGGRIPVKYVTYQTEFGEFHTVTIEASKYTQENVKKAIEDEEKTTDSLIGKAL